MIISSSALDYSEQRSPIRHGRQNKLLGIANG